MFKTKTRSEILKVPLAMYVLIRNSFIDKCRRCFTLNKQQRWHSRTNVGNIEENEIFARRNEVDVTKIEDLEALLNNLPPNSSEYIKAKEQYEREIRLIPNDTHPAVLRYQEPLVVRYVGNQPHYSHKPLDFQNIAKRLSLARADKLGNVSGSKSYYILGELAEIEHSLIQYSLDKLLTSKFKLISVPDLLPRSLIEKCGLNTHGERTQVYFLDKAIDKYKWCLSGTSEMALAGYLRDKILDEEDLPLKLAAVSRCYRAETSNLAEERGIYRVHEFTKVEMFLASLPENSDDLHDEIKDLQCSLFEKLDLHFKVLDMPSSELGMPAYRKYDVEAWMSGRGVYGEISSCSNCTDYQSKRLNIKYRNKSGKLKYVHTLNGTAAAIPRLLIALVENGQRENGRIVLPAALKKYLQDKNVVCKQKRVPELKLIKHMK